MPVNSDDGRTTEARPEYAVTQWRRYVLDRTDLAELAQPAALLQHPLSLLHREVRQDGERSPEADTVVDLSQDILRCRIQLSIFNLDAPSIS